MRILVTGGTGFIGSNLTRVLLDRGHDVSITGHDAEQQIPNFRGRFFQPSFLGLDWDAIGSVDAVFHQAAINNTVLNDRKEMLRANVESSEELFLEMIKRGCKRVVYASSTAIYGNAPPPYKEDGPFAPLNVYGESKKLLDELVVRLAREHPNVTFVGLRYCNVYGPGETHKGKRASMIYQLAQQMKAGDPRVFEFGEQKRDYLYVKDVVRANLLALEANKSTIVNCGSGVATSFNEVISLLNASLGLNRKPVYIKNPYLDSYQSFTLCDMTRAKEQLGFVPEFSLKQGIEDYQKSGLL